MHPVEDNIHWISPNPNNVFGEKGKGTSAALKIARSDTGEIKIVNEENRNGKRKLSKEAN